MFTRPGFELKVGIFIFIGLVILSVMVFSIGNFYSIKKGYTIDIIFSFANGISVGAPVRYAGVEVGEIQKIKVYFDERLNKPMVMLRAWVSQDTWINEDAKATINTLGLLGEKYLEVEPGTREARLLQKGDNLRGRDPVSTEELARESKQLLNRISGLVKSIDTLIGDEKFKESIKNTVSNFESVSSELKEFSALLKDSDGTLGLFLKDDKLYKDIDEMILDIKQNPWKLLYRPKDNNNREK